MLYFNFFFVSFLFVMLSSLKIYFEVEQEKKT